VPLHCLLPTKVRSCSIERYSLIQWDQTGIGWDKQCHVKWHPCQHAIILFSTTKFYILTLSLGILINTRISLLKHNIKNPFHPRLVHIQSSNMLRS
jgi:hypothetical protein